MRLRRRDSGSISLLPMWDAHVNALLLSREVRIEKISVQLLDEAIPMRELRDE